MPEWYYGRYSNRSDEGDAVERKYRRRPLELSAAALHICGLPLLAAGCLSSVIQSRILGVGRIGNAQLLEVIQNRPDGMAWATLALVGQVLEICAVPVFAFLLSEGARHTASCRKYLLRVIGLAGVCEIPYNLLTSGSVFAVGSLNPVFGAALSLVMIYFFRTFRDKRASHTAIKAVAVLGAYLWSTFLGVAFGGTCVIFTAVLWAAHEKQNLRLISGCFTGIACAVFSPLYLFSPLAFLVIHFYSGERGGKNRLLKYLSYPLVLTVCLLISRLAE